eukprot:2435153-Prymnesium_polylepis.1
MRLCGASGTRCMYPPLRWENARWLGTDEEASMRCRVVLSGTRSSSTQVLAATGCTGYCSGEVEAHAATFPQPWDYHHPLSFRHALAAWYFVAPGERRLAPSPTAKPGLSRPPSRAAR